MRRKRLLTDAELAVQQREELRRLSAHLADNGVNARQLAHLLHVISTRDGHRGLVRAFRPVVRQRIDDLQLLLLVERGNHARLHTFVDGGSAVCRPGLFRARCTSTHQLLTLHFAVCVQLGRLLARPPAKRWKGEPALYTDIPAGAETRAGAIMFLSKHVNLRELALLLAHRTNPTRPLEKPIRDDGIRSLHSALSTALSEAKAKAKTKERSPSASNPSQLPRKRTEHL